jgi:hypothetical protein
MKNWFFPVRRATDKARNPVLGEFFTTASIKTIADSIVRESIQNSIDAGTGPGPVVIRFAVGRCRRAETDDLFNGLWEHVGAADEEAGILSKENDFRYVTIEDFETTGLQGDPEDVFGDDGDKDNEFYFFVRAEGLSPKTGELGSWGVGKYTYLDASMINTMFVLTARGGNGPVGGNGPLAIGMAVLKNHKLANSPYTPDGYLAEVRPLTGGDYAGEDAILPFGPDSGMPERIRAAFNLQRTDESGLSVVVPYVPAELTYDELVGSVARNYGILIGSGSLAVTVVDETGDETTLDSGSILTVLEGLEEGPERQELIDELNLSLWAADLSPENRIQLGEHPLGIMPSWRTDGLMTENQAKTIRDALATGESLAVRVPIPITPKTDEVTQWSYLDILFGHSETKETEPHFYRQGLRISEVKSKGVSGLRSLVIIDDRELAAFLGTAEGVSHVDWSATTKNFAGHYTYGSQWLSFIKGAPHQILRLARSAEEDEDRELAVDYFSVEDKQPEPKKEDDEETTEDDEGKVEPSSPPLLPKKPKLCRIEKLLPDGFSVTCTRPVPEGQVVTIGVAYDIPRGNPLTNWQPEDFRLDYMTVEMDGGQLVEKSDNKIQVSSTGDETLKVKVRGFDSNRDLFVEASLSEDS